MARSSEPAGAEGVWRARGQVLQGPGGRGEDGLLLQVCSGGRGEGLGGAIM